MTLTILMTALMAMTSFAGTLSGPGEEPKYAGMSDMVYELYSAVQDEPLHQMAIDTNLVMIGEKAPTKTYSNGAVEIGRYEGEYNLNNTMMISLLGNCDMLIGLSEGKSVVATGLDYILDEEAIEQNRSDLEKIYCMVKSIQQAVSGMNDVEKLKYIETYIRQIVPTYTKDCDSVMALTLRNGTTDCDGFTALNWLIGINCGLDITCVSGFTNGECHAWNKVVIDGKTYWNDITWDLTSASDKYFLMDPSDFTTEEREESQGGLGMIIGYVSYS